MDYKIEFSGDDLQYIVTMLEGKPFKEVSLLLNKIMTQVKVQNDMKSNENA